MRKTKKMLQAAAAQKASSEFLLDSALSEAEEQFADRHSFTLETQRWDELIAALDAPPGHHPRIERLFREPSFFDRKR